MTGKVHLLKPPGTLTCGFRETLCGSLYGPREDGITFQSTLAMSWPGTFQAVEPYRRESATCKNCLRRNT